ncbi:MAG: AAA family ATPase [Candidatus Obscuribacterales bacterium]
MKFTIERFYIKGLHGRRSIDIPITDNRLILVGENGSGKTTIINLLYFFLSRQWARLADFNFDSISLTIDGQELKITADQLRQKGRITRSVFEHYQRRVPKFVVERIRNHLTRMSTKKYDYAMTRSAIEELAWRYGRELDVHPELIHDLALQMLEEPRQHNQFEQLETELCKMFQGQILYLPTYRRIEQDLKSIFPHLDVDRLIGRREEYRGSMDPTYTELVEFGMRDVDDQIKRKM